MNDDFRYKKFIFALRWRNEIASHSSDFFNEAERRQNILSLLLSTDIENMWNSWVWLVFGSFNGCIVCIFGIHEIQVLWQNTVGGTQA